MKHFCIPVAILCCLSIGLLTDAKPRASMTSVTEGQPPTAVKTRKNAQDYLMYYNYMADEDDDMYEAIKSFQRMANVNVTGELDEATMEMMNMPRCGVRDNMGTGDKARKRRYSAVIRWPVNEITWRINRYSQDLGTTQTRDIMRRALQLWADQTPLTFTEVTSQSGAVDFEIEFARGAHGDNGPFDGPNGILAHAYFPNGYTTPSLAGDAHFDDDETYTHETTFGTNLLQVAAHEFGHSLGLDHSEFDDALMAPFYRGYIPNFVLHPDDIAGIQSLYGKNVGQPDATMRPYPVTPEQPGDPQCPMSSLDAVTRTDNGNTYFFKGSQVWQIETSGVAAGFPKEISEVFQGLPNSLPNGLPNDLDAAVYFRRHDRAETRTYFFKGSQCYEYYNTLFRRTAAISQIWPGLPDNIDSAFVWSGNGRAYFTKGNQYYRFNLRTLRVDDGYPRTLNVWNLMDANDNSLPMVDTVFQWLNSRTYFFHNDQYYRFDDKHFRVDNTYPRDTAYWWFGCGDQSYIQGSGAMATVLPSVALLTLSSFLYVFLS